MAEEESLDGIEPMECEETGSHENGTPTGAKRVHPEIGTERFAVTMDCGGLEMPIETDRSKLEFADDELPSIAKPVEEKWTQIFDLLLLPAVRKAPLGFQYFLAKCTPAHYRSFLSKVKPVFRGFDSDYDNLAALFVFYEVWKALPSSVRIEWDRSAVQHLYPENVPDHVKTLGDDQSNRWVESISVNSLPCVFCSTDDEQRYSYQDLLGHMMFHHHRIQLYACHCCGQAYTEEEHLYKESHCREFKDKSAHQRFHLQTSVATVVCTECGFQYVMSASVDPKKAAEEYLSVMLTHTSRSLMMCITSSHTAIKAGHVKVSVTSRANLMPGRCSSCNVDFNTIVEGRKHFEKKHPELERFKCVKCPYSTCNRNAMRDHMVGTHLSKWPMYDTLDYFPAHPPSQECQGKPEENFKSTTLPLNNENQTTIRNYTGMVKLFTAAVEVPHCGSNRADTLTLSARKEYQQEVIINVNTAEPLRDTVSGSILNEDVYYCKSCSSIMIGPLKESLHLKSCTTKETKASDTFVNLMSKTFLTANSTLLCPCCPYERCSVLSLRRHMVYEHDTFAHFQSKNMKVKSYLREWMAEKREGMMHEFSKLFREALEGVGVNVLSLNGDDPTLKRSSANVVKIFRPSSSVNRPRGELSEDRPSVLLACDNAVHYCHTCKYPLESVAAHIEHLKKKHFYICPDCGGAFLSLDYYDEHACRSMLPQFSEIKCSNCPTKLDSFDAYYTHLLDEHFGKVIFCPNIGQLFPRLSDNSLVKIPEVILDDEDDDDDIVIEYPVRNQPVPEKIEVAPPKEESIESVVQSVVSHMMDEICGPEVEAEQRRTEPIEVIDDDLAVVDEGKALTTQRKEPTLQCPKCSAKFYKPLSLKLHMKEHVNDCGETIDDVFGTPRGKKVLVCRLCCLTYEDSHVYGRHRAKHGHVFSCCLCNAVSTNKNLVEEHYARHDVSAGTERLVFACSTCSLGFHSNEGFCHHMSTEHKQDLLFYCKCCGFGHTDADEVVQHVYSKCEQTPVSTLGVCLASVFHYQPKNVEKHRKFVAEFPEESVTPSECVHRSFSGTNECMVSCPVCSVLIPFSTFYHTGYQAGNKQTSLRIASDECVEELYYFRTFFAKAAMVKSGRELALQRNAARDSQLPQKAAGVVPRTSQPSILTSTISQRNAVPGRGRVVNVIRHNTRDVINLNSARLASLSHSQPPNATSLYNITHNLNRGVGNIAPFIQYTSSPRPGLPQRYQIASTSRTSDIRRATNTISGLSPLNAGSPQLLRAQLSSRSSLNARSPLNSQSPLSMRSALNARAGLPNRTIHPTVLRRSIGAPRRLPDSEPSGAVKYQNSVHTENDLNAVEFPIDSTGALKCPHTNCDATFESRSQGYLHRIRHIHHKFFCMACGRAQKSEKDAVIHQFRAHIRRFSPEDIEYRLTCPCCYEVFGSVADFSRHISEADHESLICSDEQCFRRFGSARAARHHSLLHGVFKNGLIGTPERPQCCAICATVEKYWEHQLTDTFTINHTAIHGFVQCVVCRSCGIKFPNNDIPALELHFRSTHIRRNGDSGPVKCDCGTNISTGEIGKHLSDRHCAFGLYFNSAPGHGRLLVETNDSFKHSFGMNQPQA